MFWKHETLLKNVLKVAYYSWLVHCKDMQTEELICCNKLV